MIKLIKLCDGLYYKFGKAVPKSTYQHSDTLGAGAKKRKKLKNTEDKVEAVMHEFKTGTLKSSSGKKVTDKKQAIAIAMSESGQSKYMKIGETDTGNKSKPSKYENVEKKEFADTTNYKYPLDSEDHVRAAISYFAMPKNYSKYEITERKIIANKIKNAAKKYKINLSNDWLKKFNIKKP